MKRTPKTTKRVKVSIELEVESTLDLVDLELALFEFACKTQRPARLRGKHRVSTLRGSSISGRYAREPC